MSWNYNINEAKLKKNSKLRSFLITQNDGSCTIQTRDIQTHPKRATFWIILRFCETTHLPSSKLTLTLTSHLGKKVGLGKG